MPTQNANKRVKTQQILQRISVKAESDLLYTKRFVGFSGTYAGNGESALGVLDATASTGEMAPVITYGVVLVEAGGAINKGAGVQSDANGKAVAKTTEGTLLGYALDSSAADGDIVRVKLL